MRDSSLFLHLAYLGKSTDSATLRHLQLLAGLSVEDAAALCGVSPETYRRWRRDRRPNVAAVRLLAVVAGYFPWRGWEGWEMHNGFLFPPGYTRNGITPADIYAVPFSRQLLTEYKRLFQQLEPSLSASNSSGDDGTACLYQPQQKMQRDGAQTPKPRG